MSEAWTDLRIEGESPDLALLKAELARVMDPLGISEETQISQGKTSEPIIIAILVALGGARLTEEVFTTIRHWMDHRERMAEIRLSVENDQGAKRVTLEALKGELNSGGSR